ncbi:hypothetical protein HNY73_007507 [Argiope bruennichi]|uniref:Uncharacterized protein n=1 Tax=Argiope bruennichi TaxID=94029 RepID=A0A8T0FE53_ARGBR|nr:hypothetical protein HNY73_007507 [Argiope bruennichi]
MFFQLQLNEFSTPLSILIGKGGNMYVKLVGIGMLLHKSNPYAYRNLMKHFADEGKDVLSTTKTLTSHYVPIVLAYKFIMSVVKEEYSDDMNIPEEVDDTALECGVCENIIWDHEEFYLLECGCVHHLFYLLDNLDTLVMCPQCQTPLLAWDYLILIAEKELLLD